MTPALPGLQTVEPTAVPEPAPLPSTHIRLRDGETAAFSQCQLWLGVLLNYHPFPRHVLKGKFFPAKKATLGSDLGLRVRVHPPYPTWPLNYTIGWMPAVV